MADASKLKRLGVPPPVDEARTDLVPELESQTESSSPKESRVSVFSSPHDMGVEPQQFERIDGRSLRRTGRTVPFSTRVSDELDIRIRRIAAKHKLKIVEIIEQGIDLLEAKLKEK